MKKDCSSTLSITILKRTFFSKVLLYLSLFTILFGCVKDSDKDYPAQDSNFGIGFETFNYKALVPYSFNVDWEEYRMVPSDSLNEPLYEFAVKENGDDTGAIVDRHKQNGISITYKVLARKDEKGFFQYYMAKFTSINEPSNQSSFTNLSNFTGRLSLFDASGNKMWVQVYKNGGHIGNIDDPKKESTDTAQEDVLQCTLMHIPTYTDWYYDRGSYYEYAYTSVVYHAELICSGSGGSDPSNSHSLGFQNDGSHGGGNTSQNEFPEFNDEIISKENVDPSCESFDFYNVGTTGVQVAAVNGIWDIVYRWDRCPGIGAAASYQIYYFHLPAHLNRYYAAEKAADALSNAFYDLQSWFRKQPCG